MYSEEEVSTKDKAESECGGVVTPPKTLGPSVYLESSAFTCADQPFFSCNIAHPHSARQNRSTMSYAPMDFSYDNGTGPIDGRSPFGQLQHNVQRFPSSDIHSPSKKSMHIISFFGAGQALTGGVSGVQNGFGSPSKQRAMGTLPSTPSRQVPAYNAMFTTPRTSHTMDIDDSSAGETPRSPDRDADSEATPDIKNARSAKPKLDMDAAPTLGGAERTDRNSPTKEKKRPHADRRGSWYDGMGSMVTKFKNKFNSPGRNSDMILRSDNHSRVEKSVTRRRKQEIDRVHRRKRRHSVSDSEADGDYHPPSSPRKTSSQQAQMVQKEPHWMRSLFTFIADHPTVPQILSFYAQLAFNFFILVFCAYLIYCFWSAISADVDKEAAKEVANIIAQQINCAKEWNDNKCDPETRVRRVESFCEEMERCIAQDPNKVGRARMSAHTFAGIFNSFVEPISYKAMAFTFILVFGCFAVRYLRHHNSHPPPIDDTNPSSQISNLAFGIVRNKANQYQQGPYQQQHYAPPPPTPQRTFSGQDVGFYQQGTPWQGQPYPGFEPQPSGGFGVIEGQGSPVRRLGFRQ